MSLDYDWGYARACSHQNTFAPQSLFFVSVKFNGDHVTAYTDEVKSGHPHIWDIT